MSDISVNNSNNSSRQPFLAFAEDSESLSILKQFIVQKNWSETIINSGNIETATDFLRKNPSPKTLFIDIPDDISKVKTLIDALADVCAPDIKVIVSGKINEYSFYCWLVESGIASYLLKPFTIDALKSAYNKATEIPHHNLEKSSEIKKEEASIISIIGARGGVGVSTICTNLAWLIANRTQKKTALLDFDPQLGTIALALDLEAGKGMKDALEKPDRIDSLFVDRVMSKVNDHLSILSSEEPLEEKIITNEIAAEAILKQSKAKFSYIIIDIPRHLTPFSCYALANSEHIICVTEYNILGLRDSLRYFEYFRDILKSKLPIFIANNVGKAGKYQMPQEEFEKGLGSKILFNIPFGQEVYETATSGEVMAENKKNSPISKALQQIADYLSNHEVSSNQTKSNLFSFLKGK